MKLGIAAAVALAAVSVHAGFGVLVRDEAVVHTPKPHTVTFRAMNGTVLESRRVATGAAVTPPAAPVEANMTFSAWDGAEKLANVTNDVTVWALYEASAAYSKSTSLASKSIADRTDPYTLDEYFRLYDNLAWSDEFSGSALDADTSSYSTKHNWYYDMEQRNGELHKHVTTLATVSDGTLKLTCRRHTNGDKQFEATGLITKSRVAFKYGRCEIRAKLCHGLGVWPAFWFMGTTGNWPKCGEIDAMEQMNGGEWIASTLHIPHPTEQYSTLQSAGTCGPVDGVHWADGFHRIGVIVNEREIVFYTDDVIHERIDIRDSRYSMLKDRAMYILLGTGMGGAWSGVTSADQVPASFQSEDYVIDYCRIYTNPTEGRAVEYPETEKALSGPVSTTVWRGWDMAWGRPGAGAYQNDISTNGFTELFYVNKAINEHVARDRPDAIMFLTDPACKTGREGDTGAFWTNLQMNVEGWAVTHVSPSADNTNYANRFGTLLYDSRRFVNATTTAASAPCNALSTTNFVAITSELTERKTGAKVYFIGVNLLYPATPSQLVPLYTYLNGFKDRKTVVMFLSQSSGADTSVKDTVASSLNSAFRLIGTPYTSGSYRRRVYSTGSGTAVTPEKLTIVNPAKPKKASLHTMPATQAEITF